MLNLKTYVLRFWETEFSELRPMRTKSGQRVYDSQQVELLRRIQHLLHEQGMTIEGAKRVLSETQQSPILPNVEELKTIQLELEAIRNLLQGSADE